MQNAHSRNGGENLTILLTSFSYFWHFRNLSNIRPLTNAIYISFKTSKIPNGCRCEPFNLNDLANMWTHNNVLIFYFTTCGTFELCRGEPKKVLIDCMKSLEVMISYPFRVDKMSCY